jgi:hypothetical protein
LSTHATSRSAAAREVSVSARKVPEDWARLAAIGD